MSPTFQYDLPMRVPGSPSPTKRHFSHRRQPKVADVTRLLDPSYLSSSASSSPTSVYEDTDGNLHDPDYRHFPVVAPTRRPAWERGGDEEDEDEEYDERAGFRSASPRERRRARYSAYEQSTYYPRRSFEEIVEENRERHTRRKLRSRSHSPTLSPSRWVDEEPEPIPEPPKLEEDLTPRQEVPEWTPTCGQQLKRQWQAFALSVRFSIFRAKRRIRSKVGV